MVNMIIEYQIKGYGFDADPHSLTTVTQGDQPLRTLAAPSGWGVPGCRQSNCGLGD